MKKYLAILAVIPMLMATSCGSAKSNENPASAYTQDSSMAAVENFEGKIETDKDGVNTYSCPAFTISDYNNWKMDTQLAMAEDEYFVTFTNSDFPGVSVSITAYTSRGRKSTATLVEELKEENKKLDHFESEMNATYRDYKSENIMFENFQSGEDHKRVDYYLFDTGKALFKLEARFNTDSGKYSQNKNAVDVILKQLEIIND